MVGSDRVYTLKINSEQAAMIFDAAETKLCKNRKLLRVANKPEGTFPFTEFAIKDMQNLMKQINKQRPE